MSMSTGVDLEHSLGVMVEASEEEDSRIEMQEVITGEEVLEVTEVATKVNGMEEIRIIREIMVEEEIVGVEEEMVGVEEEMVGVEEVMAGETVLETSNMVETLEIKSRSR